MKLFKKLVTSVCLVILVSCTSTVFGTITGDDCSTPIIITESVTYNGSTNGATGSSTSSCSYNDTADVWHSFTPTQTGNYTISLCGSSFDTSLSVYDGCGGTELACNDDICSVQSEVVVALNAGSTYLIRVAGYGGDTGDYVLNATKRNEPPVNDDIGGAIEVLNGSVYLSDTLGATGSDSCGCAAGYDFYDIWHSFTPSVTNIYTISLCGSNFDTTLSIRNSSGAEIACNDDYCDKQSQLSTTLTSGQTYYIRIAGYDGATGEYALNIFSTPVNDDCADALDLTLNVPYLGTSVGATGTSVSGCSNNDKLDVWHAFTPSQSGYHTISLCGSSFDTTLSVYDGCSGTSLACNDNMCDVQSEVVANLTAGQRYLVRIAGRGNKTGDYVVVVTERFFQPANDDISGAIEVYENVTYSSSTVGALGDTGSTCGYGYDFYDVWHRFSPTETKDYLISLCSSDFDTIVALYDNTGQTELGCNDDSCSNQSAMTASLVAGQSYLIRVSGYDGDMGNYVLNITESVPPPANDECADAIALQLETPYTGSTVGATGSSTSSCSDGDFYDVWFSFTPSVEGNYTIDLCESQFDTTVSVYDSCGGVELGCDDDACETQSSLGIYMQSSTNYLIRVAGYRGAIGSYKIIVKASCLFAERAVTPSPTNKSYDVTRDLLLTWNGGDTIIQNLAASGIVTKGIYGTDDRLDEYQVSNASLKAIGDSTVALIPLLDVTDNGNGTYSVPTQSLADYYLSQYSRPLCPDEPFRDQPSAANCTGFLVGDDLIATTGHCVESSTECVNTAFVFGYRMLNSTTAVTTFDASDVYFGKSIIASVEKTESDWALIRLDRKVTNHAPVTLRRSGSVATGQSLSVIGHTLGLPRKYANNATVKDNSSPQNFQANLDTYMGSSGSPVVNMSTFEVEGVLFAGNTDFVADGTCDRSAVYPDSGLGGWEVATRVTEFSEMIPVFDVYLGTDPCSLEPIATGISQPWISAPELDCGRNYYWQVVTRSNCSASVSDIWVFSTELAGDMDNDCDVDMADFSELAVRWMADNCDKTNNYCGGADIDKLGSVSITDLLIFVENWMSQITP